MARYYVNIKEKDGTTTEIWCHEDSLGGIISIIEMKKNKGVLRQARIYRYQGRKRILEKVIM